MATLSKKDLRDVFIFLGLIFLLDSIPSGFIIPGVIVFSIVLAFAWLSGDSDYPIAISGIDSEIVLRAAVAIILLGVLLFRYWILAIGILVGMVLLFLPHESYSINILELRIIEKIGGKTATKHKK